MVKCLICDRQPRQKNSPYCGNCASKIAADTKRRSNNKPVKFATYRGHVVGFCSDGDGKLRPRLLARDPGKLPKSRTINLDTYCPGFTREQVKKIKKVILVLVNAK